MTGSAPGEPAPTPNQAPASTTASTPAPSGLGLFRFSIEGRRAPALFVGGWLGTLLGAGFIAISLAAGPSLAAGIVFLAGLASLLIGLVLLGGSQAVERRAAGAPYAGPSPVLLFVAAVAATFLAAAVLGTALEALGIRFAPGDRAVGDLVSVVVQALVFVGLVRLLVVGTGALTWREMGLTADPRRILDGLAAGLVLVLPVIFVTAIVAQVAVMLVGETPPSPLPATGSAVGLALHLVAAAGIAPIAEELFFRGASLTAWLRSVGPSQAIVRTAVLFAAAHVLSVGGATFEQAAGTAVVATAVRLPVALALGWLYVRTRTIWAPIGLHAGFNAILVVLGELSQAAV